MGTSCTVGAIISHLPHLLPRLPTRYASDSFRRSAFIIRFTLFVLIVSSNSSIFTIRSSRSTRSSLSISFTFLRMAALGANPISDISLPSWTVSHLASTLRTGLRLLLLRQRAVVGEWTGRISGGHGRLVVLIGHVGGEATLPRFPVL